MSAEKFDHEDRLIIGLVTVCGLTVAGKVAHEALSNPEAAMNVAKLGGTTLAFIVAAYVTGTIIDLVLRWSR